MKISKRAKKQAIVATALVLTMTPALARSGWVDDWITNKQYTAPSSFQGATRGYYSGGSFQAHWKNTNDYLMTISKPHLKSGCGGIDAFMGGFGFMDTEYLVQKLERIMSAAPAAAFDLALKAVSEQISGTLKDLGSWADKLNQLQLDDCKASKALVATIASPASGMFSEKMQSEIKSAQSDFWASSGMGNLYKKFSETTESEQNAVTEGTAPNAPTIQQTANNAIAGCPQDILDVYGSGSILGNIGGKKGLDPEYIALIRGFIGDVKVTPPNVTGTTFHASLIPACDGNASLAAFLKGDSQTRSGVDDACNPVGDTNASLITYSSNMINSIIGKMKAGIEYSEAEKTFIALVAPSGTFDYLKIAAVAKLEGPVTQELVNITSNAVAYYMLRDLFDKVDGMSLALGNINTSTGGPKVGADPATCKKSLFEPTQAQFEALKERIQGKIKAIEVNYKSVLDEARTLSVLKDRIEKTNKQIYSEVAMRFSKGVADHLAQR